MSTGRGERVTCSQHLLYMLIPVSAYNVCRYIVRMHVYICLRVCVYFACGGPATSIYITHVYLQIRLHARTSPLSGPTHYKSAQWKRCQLNRLASLQFVNRVRYPRCHHTRLILMSNVKTPVVRVLRTHSRFLIKYSICLSFNFSIFHISLSVWSVVNKNEKITFPV